MRFCSLNIKKFELTVMPYSKKLEYINIHTRGTKFGINQTVGVTKVRRYSIVSRRKKEVMSPKPCELLLSQAIEQ